MAVIKIGFRKSQFFIKRKYGNWSILFSIKNNQTDARLPYSVLFLCALYFLFSGVLPAYGQPSILFESSLLEEQSDLSALMVEGIDRYLDRETKNIIKKRSEHWNVDFSDKNSYNQSVVPKRKKLSRIIGAVDSRLSPTEMEYLATTSVSAKVAENEHFITYAVRWPVFEGVYGEGLLLQPKKEVRSRVIAIPDADQTPEMIMGMAPGISPEGQFARRLAENGCQVVIPTIIDRSHTGSGSKRLDRFTNQPHREWIYRQAYTFGRHVIGYEVQKIISAIDWLAEQNEEKSAPIGVMGWGEGALLSLYSAALDTRVDVTLVSGYFSGRQDLWKEPIYRNLFGLHNAFGDAEIAGLIVPRTLMVEYAASPEVQGPPKILSGPARLGASAAPGSITTPLFSEVKAEMERARELTGPYKSSIHFIDHNGKASFPLGSTTIFQFLKQLQPEIKALVPIGTVPSELRAKFDPMERQLRQVKELENHTQQFIGKSDHIRQAFFWDKLDLSTPEDWQRDKQPYRKYFWEKVIGKIPDSPIGLNPKSRKILDKPEWVGYEVTLDVLPDVFAWGYLLLPKDIKSGERRPVMVVQHGGGGVPADLMDESNKTYKRLAVQLVERGFVVFAPHFPWKEGDNYRNLQRKANPLGLSIFSIILNQHERILDWLTEQPWTDPERIGLYGLSWGGKVAMRVPALLDRYSLSICSGDFNEWIWKNATTDWANSYMFVPEYEMFDFNLGMTFNYGEMAALIAPRAFMVERGHNDGVGIDEWVAFEYAKVKRLYDQLNIPEKTEIEYFNGGHEINAEGTLNFIHRHFNWPLPK